MSLRQSERREPDDQDRRPADPQGRHTHEEFVRHWFDIHGPLAHAVPGIRRYVQSHITGTRTRPDIPETDVEVDGIAELWYDDLEAMQRAAATPEMKALTDDGALFIGRIKTYVIEERQIIPKSSERDRCWLAPVLKEVVDGRPARCHDGCRYSAAAWLEATAS